MKPGMNPVRAAADRMSAVALTHSEPSHGRPSR